MYFIWIYFLSSVPSVNIFPLFTIVKITTANTKQRKNGLMVSKRKPLNRVLSPIAHYVLHFYFENKCRMLYAHSRLFFVLAVCFYPWSLYVFNILAKWSSSWNKAFFSNIKKSIRSISIFCHTTVINAIHFIRH